MIDWFIDWRNHALHGARSEESIRCYEGGQDGDAAFRQNSFTTCWYIDILSDSSNTEGRFFHRKFIFR